MNTHSRASLRSARGFTLIEVIAVLVLLGILAAVAVPRYIDVVSEAKTRAFDAAIAELNGRESLAWAQQMIATGGTPDDATIYAAVSPSTLGDFTYAGDEAGGTLTFQGVDRAVTRTAATGTSPGRWQ